MHRGRPALIGPDRVLTWGNSSGDTDSLREQHGYHDAERERQCHDAERQCQPVAVAEPVS